MAIFGPRKTDPRRPFFTEQVVTTIRHAWISYWSGGGRERGSFQMKVPVVILPHRSCLTTDQGTAGMSYLSLENRYHLGIHTSKGTPVRE